MDTVAARFEINRESLNQYLGNTPNVTAAAALAELLGGLFSELPFYCENCGRGGQEATGIKGSVSIEPDSVVIPRKLLDRAAQCIARAEAEGAFKDCAAPQIGSRTLAWLESVT